ncbi:transposase [Sporosarcina sp. FA9]|uniref:transposase n=1 Tax=Sporosarcina sp. FA9 TaxID=3413030 RepID=UPI003F65AB0D
MPFRIKEILAYDPVLKADFELYQELLKVMSDKDLKALKTCLIRSVSHLISSDMRTCLKTLIKHLAFIKNSFIYPYKNGRIEEINNKIKV